MEVTQTEDGEWEVVDAEGKALATCQTNAEAWRAYDRLMGEPINKAEDRTDWFVQKKLNSRMK